jgi:perosamine synthetase
LIPVNEPVIGLKEFEYVSSCLKTGWISSSGKYIEDFENKWAAYCGMSYGIAVSNGTVALQVAVSCLGLKPGEEVIMPTFTIISCALAIIYNEAIPVLIDSEPDTWCMDVTKVEKKITRHTKAIMPVHIYGHPVDMDPLLELARKHDLMIIEDAAEVHGAEYLSKRDEGNPIWRCCGGIGDISTFSFYANKLITTGEGGMVLTKDAAVAEKAKSLRNLCFLPERRFYHANEGNNFRLTNMQAALGVAQLERFADIIAKKRWIAQQYSERLKEIPLLQLPAEKPWARHVYWMYAIVLDEGTKMDATEFARKLEALGVETRPFFLGMHEQPVLKKKGLFKNEKYPVAERIARQGLYLPSGLALSESQINQVCDSVKRVLL